ncbi:NAD-dependent epimerase/dehydratase family protein [Jannaschia sp. KMU-145]|uniref:polysaccharide biosynthesis C-terminal domain-containing protein n=1 Tax=Jannaschia halovivens TaxID=3388667 RepID=UPI00396B05FF
MKIVVTGAGGLIGHHAAVRLHAANCAARFRGDAPPYRTVALDRAGFQDDATLREAVTDADAVLHFAGVNRGPDDAVEAGNPAIARRLAETCRNAGSTPHVVYANSIHAGTATPYGRSKAAAVEIIAGIGAMTDLRLPHIFGEGARPFYNNVTATLIAKLLAGETPDLDPDGRVQLLHAGAAAEIAIDAVISAAPRRIEPEGRSMTVPDLWEWLHRFHRLYTANTYPDLSDPFDRDLFNSYRAATYPDGWPRPLARNTDARGMLFEAVKGGGGGQTFLSTTAPGVTRGDHFHLGKIERFLVLEGEADIRMRPALGTEVHTYRVTGAAPAAVDMPTLWTHSIENVGTDPLLTLFWTHDLFDPTAPDTYADKVLVT